jgi:23S rRNA (guanosine2251-2'-O)-methyltransferase
MISADFIILECNNKDCLFRFPIRASSKNPVFCPKCKSSIKIALKYNDSPSILSNNLINKNSTFSLLLDNLRSAYNVGSILRSADGFNIDHIYFCGMTATPENRKIEKTSLGAENTTPWSYSTNSLITAQKLKENGNYLYGLEMGPKSKPIFKIRNPNKGMNTVLIVGNELGGIDPMVRDLCNEQIYIPMMGKKHSFNVTIAFGIAAFYLRYISDFNKSI